MAKTGMRLVLSQGNYRRESENRYFENFSVSQFPGRETFPYMVTREQLKRAAKYRIFAQKGEDVTLHRGRRGGEREDGGGQGRRRTCF